MKKYGFTIVELLIVIVVIGILAAISIVAYNNVTTSAKNTSRVQELKQWHKHFELYKAQYGSYLAMDDGGYCLGTGFPSGSGGGNTPRCRTWNSTGSNSYTETASTSLMNTLRSMGSITQGDRSPIGALVGPYVIYNSATIRLFTFIQGSSESDCPSDMSGSWTDGTAVQCRITLNR